MAKKFPAHRIKSHRVYDVKEISELLGCHRKTVTRWIGNGDVPANTARKPWLIDGRDLKHFLGVRQARKSWELAPHHCLCFGCQEAREPHGKIADYVQQTSETGRLIALCPICGALMSKIVRRADLEAIRSKIDVTIQPASPRIVSPAEPHSFVPLTQEPETHGKAQQR